MKTRFALFATLLLLALMTLSGCDSIAALLSDESAPADSSVAVASFKLYDSWAQW
ncbi:MAG: hypothetical protein OXG92_08240 [Chloroflexi bacterium]|nr:hypothetical protein [Chloroflexota bacterium]MCY3581247.1 hypothetical protein [Chloroflexota bacterium]MCY3716439.1 hypothetical protein [Chloroflexota bacterium]MDE2651301.1 hypothetical protein [Chloroflexota bacterium]